MNVFEEVKQSVSMDAVARCCGFTPNRSGFIHCPFHVEKTASLKIYPDSFYCYGCGASGSQIDFVMNLYNLSPIEAVIRINDDMRLGLQVDGEPDEHEAEEAKRAKNAQERFEPLVDALKAELSAVIYRANIACQSSYDLEELTEGEALAIRKREWAEHLLEILNSGNTKEIISVVRDRKEVARICDQIIVGMQMR